MKRPGYRVSIVTVAGIVLLAVASWAAEFLEDAPGMPARYDHVGYVRTIEDLDKRITALEEWRVVELGAAR